MFPKFKIQFLHSKINCCAKFVKAQCTSSRFVNLLNAQRPTIGIRWHTEGSTKFQNGWIQIIRNFRWYQWSAVVVGLCVGCATYKYLDFDQNAHFIFTKNVVKAIEAIYFDFQKAVVCEIVEKVAPAVVTIEIEGWLWNSTGSGFIIKSDGLILTNAHVIQRRGQVVLIKLYSGEIYHGIVEDFNLATDLAVVKINASNLPVLKLADINECKVGQTVMAVGGPQLSEEKYATSGNISHVQKPLSNRELFNYVQTDAAITDKNRGGPLVNLDGEVVGINNKTNQPGISVAIPSFYAKEFLENVVNDKWKLVDEEKESKLSRIRLYNALLFPTTCEKLGLTVDTLDVKDMITCNPEGFKELKKLDGNIFSHVITVNTVLRNSPADNAGLCSDDLIFQIDNKPIRCVEELIDVAHKKAGSYLSVYRKNNIEPIIIIHMINPEVDKDK